MAEVAEVAANIVVAIKAVAVVVATKTSALGIGHALLARQMSSLRRQRALNAGSRSLEVVVVAVVGVIAAVEVTRRRTESHSLEVAVVAVVGATAAVEVTRRRTEIGGAAMTGAAAMTVPAAMT